MLILNKNKLCGFYWINAEIFFNIMKKINVIVIFAYIRLVSLLVSFMIIKLFTSFIFCYYVVGVSF